MFRGVGTRLSFSLSLMLWVTGDRCIPSVFTSNIPLVFPLGCAGGPLSVYAILDYVLSPRESWKSMHYVLWKKLSAPKAADWASLKNVQLSFSPSTKTKAQLLCELQKDTIWDTRLNIIQLMLIDFFCLCRDVEGYYFVTSKKNDKNKLQISANFSHWLFYFFIYNTAFWRIIIVHEMCF